MRPDQESSMGLCQKALVDCIRLSQRAVLRIDYAKASCDVSLCESSAWKPLLAASLRVTMPLYQQSHSLNIQRLERFTPEYKNLKDNQPSSCKQWLRHFQAIAAQGMIAITIKIEHRHLHTLRINIIGCSQQTIRITGKYLELQSETYPRGSRPRSLGQIT